jgi:hypothetical protein
MDLNKMACSTGDHPAAFREQACRLSAPNFSFLKRDPHALLAKPFLDKSDPEVSFW